MGAALEGLLVTKSGPRRRAQWHWDAFGPKAVKGGSSLAQQPTDVVLLVAGVAARSNERGEGIAAGEACAGTQD